MRFACGLVLVAAVLGGCVKDEVTEADAQKMKNDFSQESYEKAMIAAGKEKELEEEKARNKARMDGQYEGQQ